VAHALAASTAGEIVVSIEMWEHTKASGLESTFVVATADVDGMKKVRLCDPANVRGKDLSTTRTRLLSELRSRRISEEGEKRLVSYTPILDHVGVLEEGTGLQSEIKTLTVMFLMVDNKAFHERAAFNLLQQAYNLAQATIVEHEGLVKELSMDDKGLVLVAGFGLHAVMKENSAQQACKCALKLAFDMNLMKLGISIGLSTGRVFCASLGNRQRREFSFVSDTVNIAARLMVHGQNAKFDEIDMEGLRRVDPSRSHGLVDSLNCRILVEKQTYLRAMGSIGIDFTPKETAYFKGKSQRIELFVPTIATDESRKMKRSRKESRTYNDFENLQYQAFLQQLPELLGGKIVDDKVRNIVKRYALYLS